VTQRTKCQRTKFRKLLKSNLWQEEDLQEKELSNWKTFHFNNFLSEAWHWLDNNLEAMFTKHILQYGAFILINGYAFPKRGDKPRFSTQLGTYANQLHTMYPTGNPNEPEQQTKWNKSPIKQNQTVNRACVFNEEEYPKLQTAWSKWTNTGQSQSQETTQAYTPPATTGAISATALCKQILADMKHDITWIMTT